MWNLPPPPGFQGLREDLPLECYVRHLPHWRQAGATYFVTFRLGDALPQNKLHELEGIRAEWERRNPMAPTSQSLQELSRQMTAKIEVWLDQGSGCCLLAQSVLRALIASAMHHFDDERYELDAYVVMPNHVHAILRPTQCELHALEDIVKSWKQYSSKQIHEIVGGTGPLWQEESYDRIIRDEEHLDKCLQYVGDNPSKANLAPDNHSLWIRPSWQALGWNFRSPS